MMRKVMMVLTTAVFCTQFVHAETPSVIKIVAKRYEYSPSQITLRKGVPVILELTTLDRSHGFSIPDLKVRADISPGKATQIKLLPEKPGEYDFFCDIFCGSGHEGMSGKIKVTD